jgi:hypothetical protein
MNIPDFFIVGGRKCGTTSLYALLKDHPQVFMPAWKEPHFFGSDLHARDFTRERYLSLFDPAGGRKRIGEASTGYLYSRLAAAEIRDFNRDARVIIMLRNPVDALYSLHSEYVFEAVEPIEDFEEALAAEPRRKLENYRPPPAVPMEFLFYRDWVKYAHQTRRYIDAFGRERVHIIVLDDLQANPEAILRETLAFLDVRVDHRPDLSIRNPNKIVRIRGLQRFILDPRRRIPYLARRAPNNSLIRALVWLNSKNGPRQPMNPELRRRLAEEFRPEIDSLSELLGRDLTRWCRDSGKQTS